MSTKKTTAPSKIPPRCEKCFRRIGMYKVGTKLVCYKCGMEALGDEQIQGKTD